MAVLFAFLLTQLYHDWLQFNRIIVFESLHTIAEPIVSAFRKRRNRGRMRAMGAVFMLYSGANADIS